MSLRRKLLTVFAALAVMSLLSAGLTIWSTLTKQSLLGDLEEHYMQSLLLHRVSSTSTTLFRRQAIAMISDGPQASAHFEQLDRQVREDLTAWEEYADKAEARANLEAVRASYEALAEQFRAAIEPAGLAEGGRALDDLGTRDGIRAFRSLVRTILEANEEERESIHGRVAQLRQTIQLAVAISAFATFCLLLLLVAYVASDIFAPVRDIENALKAVAVGDLEQRLDAERDDELGAVNRAFNRMVGSLSERNALARGGSSAAAREPDERVARDTLTGRELLKDLVDDLRSTVSGRTGQPAALGTEPDPKAEAAEERQRLIAKLEDLQAAIDRVAAFYLPVDLTLTPTDIRALLYEVLLGFHRELVDRGISVEVVVAPDLTQVMVDGLKLREVLLVLVRGALESMGGQGGRMGLRAAISSDEPAALLVEVADDGVSPPEDAFDEALDGGQLAGGRFASPALRLAREVAERHGGRLTVHVSPGEGCRVTLELPLNLPRG